METKIDGLYDRAYRAYSNISFSPEKRAEQTVIDYEKQLSDDILNIPDEERERYIDNYKRYLFAWLSAMGNCYSVMITGGSNFNNSRHEKMNQRERARYDEFIAWRTKALSAIAKRIESSKPEEQKASERWEQLKKEISKKISWGSVANCCSMIERLAYNGEVELVSKCLELIKEYNSTHVNKFVTDRHKVWSMVDIATKIREKNSVQKQNMENVVNGIRVVQNYEIDRIQLFFEGKPNPETISNLKHNAFKWSPSNGCWQRQLTTNAIYATKRILNQ